MKRKKQIVFSILLALILLFIWSNSLAGSKQSNALSGWVEKLLKPLIDPQGNIPAKVFDYEVRKAAHIIEYAILGAMLVWLSTPIKKQTVSLLLFTALMTAVIDETIQIFTGRTSQVQDIWIDFFGAGAGMAIVYAITRVAQTRKRGV
ncbi:MAG: VanZ family protein [Eubacteriales bacterium]|nr:VanZ family protein [Eubacteriales bacterium]